MESCEDYRRHGFNMSDHFLVDYDGQGHMPPILVKCQFGEEQTVTKLDHNIPDDYVSNHFNRLKYNIFDEQATCYLGMLICYFYCFNGNRNRETANLTISISFFYTFRI